MKRARQRPRAPWPLGLRTRLRAAQLRRLGYRPAAVGEGGSHQACWRRAARPGRPPGATWVLVHGFADDALGWAPLLAHLDRHLPAVLVLELLGHGDSAVPAGGLTAEAVEAGLWTAADALLPATGPVVLVGNSMGGGGVLRLARRLGTRVTGLVLLSPAGAPLQPAELEGLIDLFTLRSQAEARAFVRRLIATGGPSRELYAWVLRRHLGQPHFVALLRSFAGFRWLAPGDLAALPPALLVWGGADRILPPSSRQFFVDHLPAPPHRHLTPAGWGHTPQVEVPQALTAAILAWAREQPGAGLLA